MSTAAEVFPCVREAITDLVHYNTKLWNMKVLALGPAIDICLSFDVK